ncbi:MAG: hypothetical protein HYY16_19485 [Planctomycetes bacterium]|nr:hypothetical protein [Planctomycetota bacterium]
MKHLTLALIGLTAAAILPGCIIVPDEPYVAHIHRDGCGHYYWHRAWHSTVHPADCHRCGSTVVHVHRDGCGHYFWHNAWYSYAHPADCAQCRPAVHVHLHRDGCGHYYWHGAWHARRHPADCCRR